MRVLRVNSLREFEVDGEIEIGSFISADNIIGISASIYQEEEEITKYLSKQDLETIKSFMPDLSEPKFVTRCYALMNSNFENPKSLPRIGSEVKLLDDEEIRELHIKDNELYIPYLPFLIKRDIELSKSVILKLINLFPEHRDLLEIIFAEIEFRLMEEVDV